MSEVFATLRDACRGLARDFRRSIRDSIGFQAAFRRRIVESESLTAFLAEYQEAYDEQHADAGTPLSRQALLEAIPDPEDKESPEHRAYTKAEAAYRTCQSMRKAKSRLGQVLRVVRNLEDPKADPFKDVVGKEWKEASGLFTRFPNMAKAEDWAKYGGEPEAPNKAPKGTRSARSKDGGKNDLLESIITMIEADLDETAAKAARKALSPIILSATERLARSGK